MDYKVHGKTRNQLRREAEERIRLQNLGETKILFTPLTVESSELGGYYFCGRHNHGYWDIFPKPVGFVKTLPDWITERQFKRVMMGERPKFTTPWVEGSSDFLHQWRFVTSDTQKKVIKNKNKN